MQGGGKGSSKGMAALQFVLDEHGPAELAAANTRLWFMQWRMTVVVGRAEAAEERGRLISGRIAELGRAWADYAEDLRRLLRVTTARVEAAEARATDAHGLNRTNGFRWADAENRATEAQERTDAAVARAAAAEARAAAAEARVAEVREELAGVRLDNQFMRNVIHWARCEEAAE